MKLICATAVTGILLFAFGCGDSRPPAPTLNVYAAASLSEVVEEISSAFTSATGTEVRFNIASSGMLARQILSGAPADLYLSASSSWLEEVARHRGFRKGTMHQFATNSLIAVAAPGFEAGPVSLEELALWPELTIAIGDPAHVPAGIYAKQALERAGLWSMVERNIIPSLDVRSALTYAWRGDADIAIIYRTDAALLPQIQTLFEIPTDLHDSIQYGLLAPRGAQEEAQQFINLLLSKRGSTILRRHGFKPLSAVSHE